MQLKVLLLTYLFIKNKIKNYIKYLLKVRNE